MPTPELPRDDMIKMLRAMQADIDLLKQRTPFANTGLSIPGPGDVQVDSLGRLIFQGGALVMNDTSDRMWLYAGGLSSNGFGLVLYRTNGVAALAFSDLDPSNETVQRLIMDDSNGYPLFAEDATGVGASWPLAPVPFAGISWPTWDSNNTTTPTPVAMAFTQKSSARLVVTARAICDGTAVGAVRLMCNGTQLGSATQVPNNGMVTVTFGPLTTPGVIGDSLNLTVNTNLQTGAGKCYARVVAAQQMGS